jgi:hypothetical protein
MPGALAAPSGIGATLDDGGGSGRAVLDALARDRAASTHSASLAALAFAVGAGTRAPLTALLLFFGAALALALAGGQRARRVRCAPARRWRRPRAPRGAACPPRARVPYTRRATSGRQRTRAVPVNVHLTLSLSRVAAGRCCATRAA